MRGEQAIFNLEITKKSGFKSSQLCYIIFVFNSAENKMQLDPKAQVVNKSQRQLDFFKSRALLILYGSVLIYVSLY